VQRPAIQRNRPRVGPVRAGQQPRHFGPARTDKAGERENFAAPNVERDVPHRAATAQIAHRQARLADAYGALGKFRLQLAAHHQFDEPVARQFADRARGDVFAVAHHRRAIAQRKHFVQPMADVNDADALRAQAAHDGEQLFHFAVGPSGGRLVHYEDAGLLIKRLGDLDQLLLRDAQLATRDFRINRHAQSRKQARAASRSLAPLRNPRRTCSWRGKDFRAR